RDSVRETTTTTVSYAVEVSEPDVPRTTSVTNHFPPGYSPSGSSPPFEYGVFGSGATNIFATYDFGLLQAGGDLDITRTGTFAVGVTADTDLLGSGRVNVTTAGTVTITETAGDL